MADRPKTRWLHLSDLHLGSRGDAVWQQVRDCFRRHLQNRGTPQPIDLILLTGDLTFRGSRAEFDRVDTFLADLQSWLDQPQPPLVIPVPGNHDLQRPDKTRRRLYRYLDTLEQDLTDVIDSLAEENGIQDIVELFRPYRCWLERSIIPALEARPDIAVVQSHFPGDLSVWIDFADGRPPLTVVGLNSAWTQIGDGDYERRLVLLIEQLQLALGAGLETLDGRHALLMMHHPPSWLSSDSRRRLFDDIHPPGRFLACLHGHMHENATETLILSGGEPRCFCQARSLFGLEGYGTRQESRAFGFIEGSLDADGTLRVQPWTLDRQGGTLTFLRDRSLVPDPEQHPDGPVLCPSHTEPPPPPPPPKPFEPRLWLQALLGRTGDIRIQGVGGGAGRGRDAHRVPIEALYTTLKVRHLRPARAGEMGPGEPPVPHEMTDLAQLLPLYPRLLIQGQPGAGKTTFLHLVATLLARDLLGIAAPDGGPWRRRWLGLSEEVPAPLPVFLKLADLAGLLAKEDAADDHRRVLALLDRTPSAAPEHPGWSSYWQQHLSDGRVMLLLDGLDEVADPQLRERLFAIVGDAGRVWEHCPMVITSRPFGVEALQGTWGRGTGFVSVTLEPFDDAAVALFIDRWVRALFDIEGEGRPPKEAVKGEAAERSEQIVRAIRERPAIRTLAENPVMLTCLCVVHWNEGGLPEGRARVYRAVLSWLLRAREDQRAKLLGPSAVQFALESFAELALAMMAPDQADGKQTTIDLDTAAETLTPIIAHHRQDLDDSNRRRRLGQAWLRWECLHGGIVEERADGTLRFWHLTFQEYLAAQALAWLGNGDRAATDWWPKVRARVTEAQWRETVDLLPGVLFDEGGRRRVDRLVARLLDLAEPAEADAPSALSERAPLYAVLARLRQTMTAYGYQLPTDARSRTEGLERAVMAIFEPEGAARLSLEVRRDVAEVLGQHGDPRLSSEARWLAVPGTAGLAVDKYPVTVEDFRPFVEGGGYGDRRYWSDEGWRFRNEKDRQAPCGWEKQQRYPNRPVVCVSWYEAEAWCCWRSQSDPALVYRLPTLEEWDQVAFFGGRTYPWGQDEPRPDHANYAGTNIGDSSPVGLFPAGDGPYGHSDLGGNVWEWTADVYESVKVKAADVEKSGPPKGVKGGSWFDPASALAAGYRDGFHASFRYDGFGFRVARAPASP